MIKPKWLLLPIAVSVIYLLILQPMASWSFTIDDSFISLRYAKHWALGQGLLWNIGENPVEGYSNFLFVVFAKWAIHLGLNPLTVIKMTGAISLIASTAAIFSLTRFFFNAGLAFIPCIWMLLYRSEILWSVSGLETITYQALIAWALFFLLKGMGYQLFPHARTTPKPLSFALSGLLLAIAGLTRPEAPAMMILFAVLALLDWPLSDSDRRKYTKALGLGFFLCTILYLPYFFWRWHYFGRLFPNPIYCKTFGFFGLLDKKFLELAWPFFMLCIPAILQMTDKRHYFFWLPSILYLFVLIDADPVSAFENRLFLPVFVLLLPLTFLGLSTVCKRILQRSDSVHTFSLFTTAFFLVFMFLPKFTLGNFRYYAINPQAGITLREEVLEWLKHNAPNKSRVVLADCGQIPYFSNLDYIDSYCLNNKSMTTPTTANMYERLCAEILQNKPEVLILTSLEIKGTTTYTPTDLCLHERLKNNNSYQYRTVYHKKSDGFAYQYEIYTLAK